jgi:hypothetical protein
MFDMNLPITANMNIYANCVALDPTKVYAVIVRMPSHMYTPGIIEMFGKSVDAELERLGIRGMVLILPTDADIQVIEKQEDMPELPVQEETMVDATP